MIYRFYIHCPGCNSTIRIRIGVGYEEIQPFFIVCECCKVIIKGKLFIKGPGVADLKMEEAVLVKEDLENPDFMITLHPDFPTVINAGEMWEEGGSPFIYQCQIMGNKEILKFKERYNRIRGVIFNDKLKLLRFITYYKTKNWELFNIEGIKLIGESWSNCENEYECIDSFYRLIDIILLLIMYDVNYLELKKEFNTLFVELAKHSKIVIESFFNDLENILDLDNIINDLFSKVEYIYENIPIFAPAIVIQHYPNSHKKQLNKFRIMRDEFDSLKTHYLDTFEICHKVLVIIVGILNIVKRNNHNSMQDAVLQKKLNNLHEFAKITSNNKSKYISELSLLNTNWSKYFNRKNRNDIGHHSIRHDLESGYLIKDDKEKISYVEFVCETHKLSTMIMYMLNVLKWIQLMKINCKQDKHN